MTGALIPRAPLLVLLLLLLAVPAVVLPAQEAETSTPAFADPRTRALVAAAMERHRSQDSLVHDYRADIRFRLSFGVGRRRWARTLTMAVEEQQGTVHWARPNDLRLDIVGRRTRSRRDDVSLNTTFERPWFVPRGLGDSVRFVGNDFPSRAALHPLASDGADWYRYELEDSVAFANPELGQVKLYRLGVVPRRTGPSLIAGSMYLDARTMDVVRLTFRYVGTELWVNRDEDDFEGDSTGFRRANAMVNRILSVNADLEYSLQEGKYWMPYRQLLSGQARVPLIGDVVVPFDLITSFSNYRINTGEPVAFELALDDSTDSHHVQGEDGARTRADTWTGGRFEIHRPADDSLRGFAGWTDSLELDLDPADDRRIQGLTDELARLSEDLSPELTGRRLHGINYERFADILRYNRVQGLSAGLGYQLRLPARFTHLQATGRLGLSDGRLTGRLAAVRDAPAGTWTLSAHREVRGVEPFTRGFAIGNSINALFVAHDNADYYLGEGAALAWERSVTRGIDLTLTGGFERQSSVEAEAESEVNDLLGGSGKFPANPPVLEGNFGVAGAHLERQGGRYGWSLTATGLAGAGEEAGQFQGYFRRHFGNKRGLSVTLRTGIATSEAVPQLLLRSGGLASVRGYDYGTLRGQAAWSAQLDYTMSETWGPRPVLFLDAGRAGDPGELFNEEPLVGAGIGFSLVRGLIRFDLSHPLTGDRRKLRFDLVFAAPR